MTIPSLMRFIDHGSGGAPEVLQAAQTDVPVPAVGEVLVKVAYAGVNRPDCLQRSGRYPPPTGASPILGLEASGHVVALGPGKLLESGQRATLSVSVGDQVIYGKYSGSDIEIDGHDVKILRESDILAKVLS